MKPTLESAKVRRAPFALALAIAALLALPLIADAAHWPQFGNDAGRSSHQPNGAGELPLVVNAKGAFSGKAQTSPIITDAPEDVPPHVAFGAVRRDSSGSFYCEVHFFKLDDKGSRVGSPSDLCPDMSSDDDTFGSRPATNAANENTLVRQGSVTPVSSSGNGAFGQTYFVHNNEDTSARVVVNGQPTTAPSNNDIAIAQYNEQTGARVTTIAVGSVPSPANPAGGATQGMQIESSPLITPANGAGDRAIFFVARPDPDQTNSDTNPVPTSPRLYKVSIPAAHTATALNSNPTVSSVDVPGANPFAAPTLAYLTDPTRGEQIPYIVVAGGGPGVDTIRTYEVSNLSPGPRVAAAPEITGTAFTPSVPPLASGEVPGSTADAPLQAPALYVPYDNGSDGTVVRKYVQEGENGLLTLAASSDTLAGAPAPALAVHDLSPLSSAGRVVVTTGSNLFVLNGGNLAQTAAFRDVEDGETLLDAGTTGFGRTTAAVARGLIYVSRDNGNHLVLRLTDGERVCRAADVGERDGCTEQEFAEHPDNNNSTWAIGQPAISRGLATYLSTTGTSTGTGGVFSYRARPANVDPAASFTIAPNPVRQNDQVTFTSTSTDEGTIQRHEWDLDGNGTFETDTGTSPTLTVTATTVGRFTVTLRVTDDRGGTSTASNVLEVQPPPPPPPPNQPPSATFTFTPAQPQVDRRVTFDASASKDPEGAAIQRYEWDLDGNGTFETNSGNNPRVQRSYAKAGVYNVKLRVTDAANAASEATRQVPVGQATAARKSPRRLTAKVRPTRDATEPFRFRTTGRLVRPRGVSRAAGCKGRVTVVVKARKRTISRRATKLRKNCTYSSRVTFSERERIGSVNELRFVARFQGNKRLKPKKAKTRRARVV